MSTSGRGLLAAVVAITYEHRLEEHLRACRLYRREKSIFARLDKVVAVVLLAVGVLGVAAAGIQWWTVIWFVLAPLEWFDALSIEPLVVRYVFRRTPKFHEPTMLSFAEDTIHYKTPSIDSTLDWSLFTEILEDDELFLLLYAAPRSYAIVPKRAFSGVADLEQFRQLARRKTRTSLPAAA